MNSNDALYLGLGLHEAVENAVVVCGVLYVRTTLFAVSI